jgi:type IV pilus assembly protein PilQ
MLKEVFQLKSSRRRENMFSVIFKRITLLCLFLTLYIPYSFAQDLEKVRLRINSVELQETTESIKVLVKSNKTLSYTSYIQESPWKLVVELPVVDISKFAGSYDVTKGILEKYTIQQKGKNENYTGVIELDLKAKPIYSIEKIENGIVITLNKDDRSNQQGNQKESSYVTGTIKNILYSGEKNKFIMIIETSTKPVFFSYTLNNPLRVVFDITNATYELPKNEYIVKNSFINSIRVDRYPGMSRVFVDIVGQKMPVFIPKAENDKLIVEFAIDEEGEAIKKVVNIENIEFSTKNGFSQIRLKKAGYQNVKALKLKDTVIVFDIANVSVNKTIQKTYDTNEASDVVRSFTLYQLKPVEENKARFVVDLKGAYHYRSYKDKDDLVFEFYKEAPVATAVAKKEEPIKTKEIKAEVSNGERKEEQKVVEKPKMAVEEPKEIEKTTQTFTEKKERPVEVNVTIKSKKEDIKPAEQGGQQYKGIPISITLKDADIQHVLKLLADAAKEDGQILNIVASDDVKGKISIQLEKVPWDQVLDLVLEVNNLGMKRIGNIIRIMPKERLKREQEELLAASKVKEKLGNLEIEIVPINYADSSELVDKIKPLLSSRGSVTVDKRNNSLIINDLKEYIAEVKKLITKLDTPPQQVVIEARVVEATSDFSREIGIQWGVRYAQTYNNSYRWGISGPGTRADTTTSTVDILTGIGGTAVINTTVPPVPYFLNLPAAIGQGAGGGINFALVNLKSGHALDIQLSALENKGMGKILSRPKITTLNNVEANIQQGSSIPYETLSDKGTQTQFIDASLQLTVTPRITPDNSIILKVKVSNNNPNTSLRSARGVPSIDKNEATTEILVRDGQTIVIGGIIRNKETVSRNGIPFLMDIPFIGWLFRKEIKTVENRELLIFLTPNIVKKITETEAS